MARHLVVLVFVVLAAACGGAVTTAGPAPDQPVSSPASPTPASPCPPEGCDGGTGPGMTPDDTEWTDVPLAPDAQGTPRPVPFTEHVVSDDGTEVTVRWWSGVEPCHVLQDVQVEETGETVTITLYEASEHPDDADVFCIELAQAKQYTVTLDQPLGDREVISGA